jgi:hypothetical protein
MPNLGSADGMLVWVMVAMKYGRRVGPNEWPGRYATPPAHTRGLSSADPKFWVRRKYMRRRCSSGLG